MYQNAVIRLAPMMGYTNAPFRLLIKMLSPSTQLFTEMVTVNAVLYNPQLHYMQKFSQEGDVVLQVGGSEVKSMLEVAKIAENQGFKEININCGCPSNRVLNGKFGAALMETPALVGEMVSTLKRDTSLNVSVKHRTGLGINENYHHLFLFAQTCISAGVDSLILHARNAWLEGINPKKNRKVPKINYEIVRRLHQDFTSTNICINGEIKSLETIDKHLNCGYADAVMIGRLSWDNPYFFQHLENYLTDKKALKSRSEVVHKYFDTTSSSQIIKTNQSVRYWLKPLVNLYHGLPGAKYWRQFVSTTQDSWQEAFKAVSQLSEQLDKSL